MISERTILFLAEGVAMAAAAAWLFYQSRTAAVILSPLAIPYCRHRRRGEREKEKRVLSGQFRELLESVNNALRSGDSTENAFREGHREMVYQYGEFAPITRETARLVRGLDNQVPLEKLLEDFAQRGGIEEIREFSEVFGIAKRGGGNMTEILARTSLLIEERLDVENEISIMLGNRRLEQRIMDILYRDNFPGFFRRTLSQPRRSVIHDPVSRSISERIDPVGKDTGGEHMTV